MVRQLKTKAGSWGKEGAVSSDPMFPGSYKGYTYNRPAPNTQTEKYKNVKEQQKKIGDAGRAIREKCKGKTGTDFTICRSEVLDTIF